MDAITCIESRRSIRNFKSDLIDHSIIEQIVKTASLSPSWKNTQIARYTALEGALKDKVAECTSKYPHNGDIIKSAPMLIVVSFVKERAGFERDGSFSTNKGTGWQMFDAGIASSTFCLAAHEKGLGTVIMGIFDDEDVAKAIDLPENQEVACLIPIGYPNESPVAPKRKEVTDLLMFK